MIDGMSRKKAPKKNLTKSQKDKAVQKAVKLVLEKGLAYGKAAERVGVHRMSVYWACYNARGGKHENGKTQIGKGGAKKATKKAGKTSTPRKRVPAKAGALATTGRKKKRKSISDANGVTIRAWKFRRLKELGELDAEKYYIKMGIQKPVNSQGNLITWEEAETNKMLKFVANKISKNGSVATFASYFNLQSAYDACMAHAAGGKIPATEAGGVRSPRQVATQVATAAKARSRLSVPEAEALQIFSYAEEAFAKLISRAAEEREYEKINFFSGFAQRLQEIKDEL